MERWTFWRRGVKDEYWKFWQSLFREAHRIETETVTSSIGPTVIRRSLHGVLLSSETSGTTTVNAYDALGRIVATSRSIGEAALLPLQSYTYSPAGDLLATHTYTNGDEVITESYAYDMLGNRIATTDAHGNTIFKSYDPLGNVVAEWGATYPVRYTYDAQNRRTSLSTTRDGTTWDTTTWTYDPPTGNCLSKTYADGSTVTYTYTPDNLLLRTTYPSGKWKENVYDAQRRLCGVVYSSLDMDYELQLDGYGQTTYASNGVAQTAYALNAAGGATNETRTACDGTVTMARTFDEADRLTCLAIPEFGYEMLLGYSTNGLIASVSNSDALVTYAYSGDMSDVGYTIAFADGGTFTRIVTRDPFRRDLILSVTNSCGTFSQGIDYTYDALSRPITRNDDVFTYNHRSEVASAIIGGNSELHEYDDIGNSTLAAYNFVTNVYTANNINQYTSILRDSGPPREPTYDADGNMTFDGVFSYSYDTENRLVSVSSNGTVLVTNNYDHKGRRVRKVTPASETTFLYDDWNLVREREIVGATTNETFYYWGKDISGTLQGAGGIGGLLYMKRNGTIYVPHVDAYGNIVRYTDTVGNVVASYTYDAFGNILSVSGPLAHMFRFLFSSKYFDVETGHYYYIGRYYLPSLMCWLSRDPILEEGGMNLYAFCGNNPVNKWDYLGKHWEFSTPRWDEMHDELDYTVKYIMTRDERRCCQAVTVDRYVRKKFGIGGRFGEYVLDHAADGGRSDETKPFIGYAEPDSPDGQTFFIYRLRWTQSFKWEARCTQGPNKGKILSVIERNFRTSGHWLWDPKREGQFL